MPADPHGDYTAVPSLAPDATPAAIRNALVDDERAEFEQRYRAAMARAADTLDLTGVLDVLRAYHRIAVQTRHRGYDTQQKLLRKAETIVAERRNPDAIPLNDHRARLDRRLSS